jgi:hypothetical protein
MKLSEMDVEECWRMELDQELLLGSFGDWKWTQEQKILEIEGAALIREYLVKSRDRRAGEGSRLEL